MKSEFDREIDWLLRGQAKTARRGASSPARERSDRAGEQGNGRESASLSGAQYAAHLDADELSAYAENALPAETRSLYTSHLADCDDCRHLVAQLALASGHTYEVEKKDERSEAAAASSSSWGAWLASLFAPRALRYAGAALTVVIVGAIAFVALRQDSGRNLVAENRESEKETVGSILRENPAEPSANAETTTTTATTATNMNAAPIATPANQPTARDGEASSLTKPEQLASAPVINPSAGAAAATSGGTGGAVNSNKTQNYAGDFAVGEAQRDAERRAVAELEMKPAPPPKPVSANAAAREEVAKNAPRDAGEGRVFKNKADEASGQNRAGGSGGAERNADVARAQPPASAPAELNEITASRPAARRTRAQAIRREEAAETETRTVAGRRFRRRDGAWIDIDYTSQATTVMRRHSEQFRALAADEPELRRIADQLGGEIVVIWKGRAYRIK